MYRPAQTSNLYTPAQTSNMYRPAQTSNLYTPAQTSNMYRPAQTSNLYTPVQTSTMYRPAQTSTMHTPVQTSIMYRPAQTTTVHTQQHIMPQQQVHKFAPLTDPEDIAKLTFDQITLHRMYNIHRLMDLAIELSVFTVQTRFGLEERTHEHFQRFYNMLRLELITPFLTYSEPSLIAPQQVTPVVVPIAPLVSEPTPATLPVVQALTLAQLVMIQPATPVVQASQLARLVVSPPALDTQIPYLNNRVVRVNGVILDTLKPFSYIIDGESFQFYGVCPFYVADMENIKNLKKTDKGKAIYSCPFSNWSSSGIISTRNRDSIAERCPYHHVCLNVSNGKECTRTAQDCENWFSHIPSSKQEVISMIAYIRCLSDEKKYVHARILANNCPHITISGRCQNEAEYARISSFGYSLIRHKNKPKRLASSSPASTSTVKRYGPPAGFNALKALLTPAKIVIPGTVLFRKTLTSSGVSVYTCLKAYKTTSEEVVAWGPTVFGPDNEIDVNNVGLISSVQTISEFKCRLNEIWNRRLTLDYKLVKLVAESNIAPVVAPTIKGLDKTKFTFCLHELRKLNGHFGNCHAGKSCQYVHAKEDFVVKPVVSFINNLMTTSELKYTLPQAIYDSVSECVENNMSYLITILMKAKRENRSSVMRSLSFKPSNFSNLVKSWSIARKFEQSQKTPADKLGLKFPDHIKALLTSDTTEIEEIIFHYPSRVFTDDASLCVGDRNVVFHKLMHLPKRLTGAIRLDPFEGVKYRAGFDSKTVCTHFNNCVDGCHLSSAVPGTILCGDCLAGKPCRNKGNLTTEYLFKQLHERMMVDDDGFTRTTHLTEDEMRHTATQYLLAKCELVHLAPLVQKKYDLLITQEIELYEQTLAEYFKEMGIDVSDLNDSDNSSALAPFYSLGDKLYKDLEKQNDKEDIGDMATEAIIVKLENFVDMLDDVSNELARFSFDRETLEDSKGTLKRTFARCKANVNCAFEYSSKITLSTDDVILNLAQEVRCTAAQLNSIIATIQKKMAYWAQLSKYSSLIIKQSFVFKNLVDALDHNNVPKTFLSFCEIVFSTNKKIEELNTNSEFKLLCVSDSTYKEAIGYLFVPLDKMVSDYLFVVKEAYPVITSSIEQEKLRARLQLSQLKTDVKRKGVAVNYYNILTDLFNVIWTSSSESEFFAQAAVYSKLLASFDDDFEEIRTHTLAKKATDQTDAFFTEFKSKSKSNVKRSPSSK